MYREKGTDRKNGIDRNRCIEKGADRKKGIEKGLERMEYI